MSISFRSLRRKQIACKPGGLTDSWCPIVNYVLDLERKHPDRQVAVVLSELVERRWYRYLLHNQRGETLTALLSLKGDRRTCRQRAVAS